LGITEFIEMVCVFVYYSGRHVVLFLDNAPSHPHHETYSNVKLNFLPANTTSVLQPLDQGVTKSLKTIYRKHLLRRILSTMDSNNTKANEIAKSVNVLDTCRWIHVAVNKHFKIDSNPMRLSRNYACQ
jgi:hypothetical protein